MSDFSKRVKDAREKLGISQNELAIRCGVTVRSISASETGHAKPRGVTLHKLAHALDVSSEYLLEGQDASVHERSDYIEHVRAQYGSRGAEEMARLLQENRALFAGGDLSEEAKDAFFRAVMGAYLACKREAQKTYGHHVQESDHAD